MPNTLITPTVIARRGLATLYNSIVLAGLMWRDFDGEFANKVGDTITVRKPAVFEAEEFDRSQGVTIQDADEDDLALKLDTILNVSFLVTDEDMTLAVQDFQSQLLQPAMEAIAQGLDAKLAKAAVDAARAAGQIETMTSVASDALIDARTVLSRNKMPAMNRYAVLSPEGTGVALKDELFVQANKSGSTDALREANIGRVFQFDTYETQSFGEGPGSAGEADGVAFHQSAVILAIRPLDQPKGVAPNQVAVESYRGLSLRVVYDYNSKYKQDEVSVDVLCGTKTAREEAAVELDFGQGS